MKPESKTFGAGGRFRRQFFFGPNLAKILVFRKIRFEAIADFNLLVEKLWWPRQNRFEDAGSQNNECWGFATSRHLI